VVSGTAVNYQVNQSLFTRYAGSSQQPNPSPQLLAVRCTQRELLCVHQMLLNCPIAGCRTPSVDAFATKNVPLRDNGELTDNATLQASSGKPVVSQIWFGLMQALRVRALTQQHR
jgi:hypothetical protein